MQKINIFPLRYIQGEQLCTDCTALRTRGIRLSAHQN